MSKKVAVIAVGGNSLIKDPKRVTVEDQEYALRETSAHIADMIEAGWDVAIGHGNGPQVGYILRRAELAAIHLATNVSYNLSPRADFWSFLSSA